MKFLQLLLGLILFPIVWVLKTVFRLDRLQEVELLPMGASLDDAIRLYDEPTEQEPDDEYPGATRYSFDAGLFHEVSVLIWKDKVHLVTYWSQRGFPGDLKYIMDGYSDNQKWNTMTAGYQYRRSDGALRLWCSAMPAIGVGTQEILSIKQQDDHSDGSTDETAPEESDQDKAPPKSPVNKVLLDNGDLNSAFIEEILPDSTGATDEEIVRVEKRIKSELPRHYRQFLSLANGGAPEFDCYEKDDIAVYCQYIYGIEDPDEFGEAGLEKELSKQEAPISKKHRFIPIIYGGGHDDDVMLSLADGSIHVCDIDDGYKMKKLAADMPGFLEQLKDGFKGE